MSILTRWPVLRDHPVTAAEKGHDGEVADMAIERWVADACADYLERCPRLRAWRERASLELRIAYSAMPRGPQLGHPETVIVSVGVTEVRPTSFSMAIRLRAVGGPRDCSVNIIGVVEFQDQTTMETRPIPKDVRDELIAIEHAAAFFN